MFQASDVFLARRELAKRSLSDFALMVDIPTVPLTENDEEDRFDTLRQDKLADHHQLICDAIQKTVEGEYSNLMLLFPPGSAKSTYADVVAVPWFMAKYPRRNVILASYASDIAKKQGRRARQLIKSKSFQNLTGVTLKSDQNAADEWAIDNGSEFMAGGLLSGLTGNRAHLGILDDPIRGREAAESETIRNKTWDAYIDDFCSRLVPGAPQIMILTRWHEDDPAGRILPVGWSGESGLVEGRDGRPWMVICCPAICERNDDPLGRKIGETLWPEWFSLEHWKPFQKNARTWSSLYQQKPSPEEGSFFKKDWFKRWSDLPAVRIYGTSDYAVTQDGGDWTVLRIWGVSASGGVYLIDGWRGQTTSNVWIERQCELIRKHKPLCWFGEAGVIQKAIEPMLLVEMRKTGARCRLEWLPSITDKVTRARGFQSRAAMGEVWLPEGLEGDLIIDEFTRFPAGKHDDEVDCGSLLGRALDMAHPAIGAVTNTNKPKPRDYGLKRASEDNSWMTV